MTWKDKVAIAVCTTILAALMLGALAVIGTAFHEAFGRPTWSHIHR